nr:hypothetical protein BaRGS_011716 [Batillaria attramentaria]
MWHSCDFGGFRRCGVITAEEPAVVKFQLELRQKSDLVYDVKTRQWHVVLQCGHFAFLGNPPVTGTEWTEASMFVDGLEARLRVIEAQQTTLQTENNRLREELEQQKNDTDARVTEVETANALLKDDNANLTELVKTIDMSEPRVSFHVLLDHDTVLNNHETLVPKVLLNNIGQGYNTTTVVINTFIIIIIIVVVVVVFTTIRSSNRFIIIDKMHCIHSAPSVSWLRDKDKPADHRYVITS